MEAIKRKYFWHDLAKDIEEYTSTCAVCQCVCVHRHKPYSMLELVCQPTTPMETISIDFITRLPPCQWEGKVVTVIFVIIDTYSKFSIYLPCRKDINAEELTELFYSQFVVIFGVPANIVSDYRSLFTSKFWSTFCFYLGAQCHLSTAFHPQTDGQTEWQNQTLKHYL